MSDFSYVIELSSNSIPLLIGSWLFCIQHFHVQEFFGVCLDLVCLEE
jgi:hypothetical protein